MKAEEHTADRRKVGLSYVPFCDVAWFISIEHFQPLWNILIAGFGIHAPGKGRKKQVRSYWDTLHSGRRFAKKLPRNPKTARQLEQLIADYYAGKPVPIISPEEAATEDGAQESDSGNK